MPGFVRIMVCDIDRGPTLATAVVSRLTSIVGEDRNVYNLVQYATILASLRFCRDEWTVDGYEADYLATLMDMLEIRTAAK